MSADHRETAPPLIARALEEGHLFDFFQLVHLLEVWQNREVPVGRIGPYREEALRFRPDRRLTFSPADIRGVERLDESERPAGDDGEESFRIVLNFLGLYGAASPSPIYLSELIGYSDIDAEPLTDFLDILNHRFFSFLYRAWVKNRYPYRFEPGARDEFSSYVLSFIGLGDPAVDAQTPLPVARLIKYLGLLSLRTRPAISLELFVSDWFGGVPTDVRQFHLRWVEIPEDARNRIGLGGRNNRLGHDLTIGERVPDRSGMLRVALGPLGFEQYLRFLPEGESFATLGSLVRLFVHERFEHDFEFTIRGREIPPLRLDSAAPARLGWTSWLTDGRGLDHDPAVVFPKKDPAAAAA